MPGQLSTDDLDVRWSNDEECQVYRGSSRVLRWFPAGPEAQIAEPADDSRQWSEFLAMVVERAEREVRGGALLHCSAVMQQQAALVFVGPSGVGKTTLWGFAEPGDRLHDELNPVELNADDQLVVSASDGRQDAVRALLFPVHADQLRLIPMKPGEAVTRLMAEIHSSLWYDRHPEHAMDFCIGAVGGTPSYELQFPKEPSVLQRLAQELS